MHPLSPNRWEASLRRPPPSAPGRVREPGTRPKPPPRSPLARLGAPPSPGSSAQVQAGRTPPVCSPESRRDTKRQRCCPPPPPPAPALLARAVQPDGAVCARRARARALTFVPLHRGRGVRSRPLRSGAALSALGSAPRPPRWPLPVRSRSPPDLLARPPRPGLSDPVPARRAAPAGELRRRAPQRPAPCASRALLPARGRQPVPSRPGPGGGGRERDSAVPEPWGRFWRGAGSGGPTRAVLPTAALQTHYSEEETEAEPGRQRRA